MHENPRIAARRRRVDADPASSAFAQLAEEYRREGASDEAVRLCRAGLAQYPGYLSARITLGRALTELGRIDEARAELEGVLRAAPDSSAARRAMGEIAAKGPSSAVPQPDAPPAPIQLESWLEAILRDRARRTGGDATP